MFNQQILQLSTFIVSSCQNKIINCSIVFKLIKNYTNFKSNLRTLELFNKCIQVGVDANRASDLCVLHSIVVNKTYGARCAGILNTPGLYAIYTFDKYIVGHV